MNKLDLTKPVKTRNGDPVTLVSTTGRHPYPVIGYIGSSPYLSVWTAEGMFMGDGGSIHDKDLIVTPVRHRQEIWLNTYQDTPYPGGINSGMWARRKEELNQSLVPLARVKVTVEFTEGEGL